MSSALLSVEIPGLPPTANHIYRTWGPKRRTKTPETRQWQQRTADTLSAMWKRAPLTGDVALSLIFVTRDKRRWDIDNRFKALLDAITMAGVIEDDSQVKRLTGERTHGEETKTIVEISLFDKHSAGAR